MDINFIIFFFLIALSRQSASSLPKNSRLCFELVYVLYTLETTSKKKNQFIMIKKKMEKIDEIVQPAADAFHFVNRRIEKRDFFKS